jgi:TonB family protein
MFVVGYIGLVMSRITTQSLFETSVHKSSWQSYAVSMIVHAVLGTLAFAVVIPVAFVEVRESMRHVTLVAPVPEYKPRPEVARLIAPKVTVHRLITPPLKIFVPPPPVAVQTAKARPIVEAPEIKPVTQQPDFKVELPPAPKAPIKIGLFQPTTELAKATPPALPQKLQVGGFGDPHGARPSDASQNAPVALAKVGAFDLPDGTGKSGRAGSSQIGGEIHQTGFGATGDPGRPKPTPVATIRTTSFGDATLAPPPGPKKAEAGSDNQTPVQILFKPKPVYTLEARGLRLEGEVSLQVIFQADGTIRVVRVVSGLGHGLDEAAAQAATRVRFKPATRGGVPVDTNATIKISFELT